MIKIVHFTNVKDEFSPTNPVKVEEMIDFCLSEDLKLFLEIPLPDNLSLELVSDYVVNELYSKKSGLYSKAVVISAWPHVIFSIRQKDPRIVCGLIWSPKLLQLTFPRYLLELLHMTSSESGMKPTMYLIILSIFRLITSGLRGCHILKQPLK